MVMNREQRNRAERLHQWHAAPEPLVLPNVWDVASARIVEQAGAKVIATTSAGMAWALGYADGEQMPVQELLSACRRICHAVKAPVSVDIERGYGPTAQDTAELVSALIELGVVGINIEDGTDPATQTLADPAMLIERIACAREVARHQGLALFINARVDTYCAPGVPTEARLEETLRRALNYIDAGADGIFVPGLADPDEISYLVSRLSVPLNIYAGYPGAPAVADLQRLGVRRVSLGCGGMQAVLAHLVRIATEALAAGRYDTMAGHMLTAAQANGLFAPVATPEHVDDAPVALGKLA
jgi:2-methylisocitrate lyase-like PEP mutase family enzyme